MVMTKKMKFIPLAAWALAASSAVYAQSIANDLKDSSSYESIKTPSISSGDHSQDEHVSLIASAKKLATSGTPMAESYVDRLFDDSFGYPRFFFYIDICASFYF